MPKNYLVISRTPRKAPLPFRSLDELFRWCSKYIPRFCFRECTKAPGSESAARICPRKSPPKGGLWESYFLQGIIGKTHTQYLQILREDTLGATCSIGPFCVLPRFRERKLNTNFFFLKLFGHPRDIPAKSRDIPPKKFDFPGFEGRMELFGPHPFTWKTPTPLENIRTKKFGFGFLFLSLIVKRKAQKTAEARKR